jgi:transcription antitermination factor NusG
MISETQDLVCQGISIPQWFAVWTAPRHEKRVSERMTDRSIEVYLPVYTTERQWKKRAPINLELPLFPGYVFVRIPRNARGKVLDTPGVYSIVGNGKQALPVPDTDIEALRSGLHLRKAEPHPYLTVGERVSIRKGALAGLEGVLVRQKSQFRVVLTVETIMQAISVEVDLEDLVRVQESDTGGDSHQQTIVM